MIGLGKMGGNMAERLRDRRSQVVGYDRQPRARATSTPSKSSWSGCRPAGRVGDGAGRASPPGDRSTSSPSSSTRATSSSTAATPTTGTTSKHADELGRQRASASSTAASAAASGACENGYALMVGGERRERRRSSCRSSRRSSPRARTASSTPGEVGAGHFAKMVHNGIEYGMMQAFAEGWELLEASDIVTDVPARFRSWRRAR